MGRLALVIDAHIVGENPGIDAAIKSKPEVDEMRYCPLIITSRRIWCHKSAEVPLD